ncbi:MULTISPECIES: formylmethanofuran dehydrogenase [Filomicrobium]|uniref:Formylmethanofuran dehydrogenase, subunit B n=1 Tax=Filomicrobium insigne TaxID=418854 RepID=A0A1H0H404_9HYPH|nr:MULTISPECIES: formylmethanofuran dehydrogenase [Filomicrobium]MCV0370341.1 formylmethanofuran dehydrogenase [Filomicrobium sp.]SDO13868.1 formylmethanofuran dehydrogenase, subunit B [Filomicrobium insigne]
MSEHAASQSFTNVPCPFCGMLCDDLEVARSDAGSLKVIKNGCPKSSSGFARSVSGAKPQISGRDVELSEAIQKVSELVRAAKQPLYSGSATDVDGMRAIMALADRSGGTVDHALSAALERNLSVLQSAGWIMSTLTEVRNRADVIVIVGTDVQKMHPRFFERIVCPPESMFDTTPEKRTIVFIGEGLDTSGAVGPRIGDVITLPCPSDQIGDVLSVLRARLRDFPVSGQDVAGIAISDLESLAALLRDAHYSVLVWSPAAFDFANGHLAVHTISEIVKDLNTTTRSGGLTLGGNEGLTTASSLCSWQSGFPLRVSYATGKPDYDPAIYSVDRMVTDGEGDLLVWVASISTQLAPPETNIPTVVLGTPGLQVKRQPEVFIPVGTPGVDHVGRLIRVDSVVSLPLQNLHRSELPRVADVLQAVRATL